MQRHQLLRDSVALRLIRGNERIDRAAIIISIGQLIPIADIESLGNLGDITECGCQRKPTYANKAKSALNAQVIETPMAQVVTPITQGDEAQARVKSCYNCEQPGHIRKFCPLRQSSPAPMIAEEPATASSSSTIVNVGTQDQFDSPLLNVETNKKNPIHLPAWIVQTGKERCQAARKDEQHQQTIQNNSSGCSDGDFLTSSNGHDTIQQKPTEESETIINTSIYQACKRPLELEADHLTDYEHGTESKKQHLHASLSSIEDEEKGDRM
ncbi:unnamed protein product [Sphagnum troendelagicum]|uniref:CCHC-type domain-containing protein n=1 Tax=Sphagnum troendelagicum TaxID=128251 RepID=A0ABP0TAG6_9BRYO